MSKKIAVLNYSGNVGKSTIAKYLLMPRMEDVTVQSIETINATEFDDDALNGEQFVELLKGMALSSNFIADIGSSNVEDFMAQMFKTRGSQKWFDFFVIPVSPPPKQQDDTISTIKTLAAKNISSDRIKLVFNLVDDDDELETVFAKIFNYYNESKSFTLDENAIVTTNDFYLKNKDSGKSIAEILDDDRDFISIIKETSNNEEKMRLVDESVIRMLADGVKEELDEVYQALFG